MLRENPFDLAGRKAGERGACPVTLLDDFYANHATFDELCCEFSCKECVATDEDMGFGGEPWLPSAQASDEGGWEIPF